MKVTKGTLLKVESEDFELPTGVNPLAIENDGSTRVKLFGEPTEILHEKAKAMREFFYQKPHLNDLANALIMLGSTHSDDEIADALTALNRRKPKPAHKATAPVERAEMPPD